MAVPRSSSAGLLVCLAAALVLCLLLGSGSSPSSFSLTAAPARVGAQPEAWVAGRPTAGPSLADGAVGQSWSGLAFRGLGVVVAVACAAKALVVRHSQTQGIEVVPRRLAFLPAALLAAGVVGMDPEEATAETQRLEETPLPTELPDRIKTDPYELIGLTNPDNSKADKKEFYMHKDYRADTNQVIKHMKISANLDKGTPNMVKWNKRVKEEMDDWLSVYRRADAAVGRQSYYQLYSAINTLASHFTSYGPKFPFPNKRRPRFFQLIETTEKYLEKGK